ncbi:MAG: enoyl-CoA hydratase/isomerase family protein [Desulfobacterales bacterium]|nr:enoyl-CoA hydratase/isomerase family protein [Desulfobacterales bacterium]MDD4071884.1 enoyl-CoA hydratase/isomerase family protein [Desulfobacterales bacterium]MDD4392493.1 enoyl-CoA hydratase/isomerase family protein [Desulfobacterales bacterium]
MSDVVVSRDGQVAVVTLARGKVNALNESMVGELRECFGRLEKDQAIRSVMLTGQGRFFSFGFDIPEFFDCSREDFTGFVTRFTELYTFLFLFPKPVIAALNGHAMAGGCMLATACDYRVMVDGKSKISLNEISFGATVLAGSVYMLRACVGHRNAEKILSGGSLYSAQEALEAGLIDQAADPQRLADVSMQIASEFGRKDSRAFSSIKQLLREPVARRMRQDEPRSVNEFVNIWYSASVRENLRQIKIF